MGYYKPEGLGKRQYDIFYRKNPSDLDGVKGGVSPVHNRTIGKLRDMTDDEFE